MCPNSEATSSARHLPNVASSSSDDFAAQLRGFSPLGLPGTGTAFALTGQIWIPMIAHAMFDLTALAIIYWNLEGTVARLLFNSQRCFYAHTTDDTLCPPATDNRVHSSQTTPHELDNRSRWRLFLGR